VVPANGVPPYRGITLTTIPVWGMPLPAIKSMRYPHHQHSKEVPTHSTCEKSISYSLVSIVEAEATVGNIKNPRLGC